MISTGSPRDLHGLVRAPHASPQPTALSPVPDVVASITGRRSALAPAGWLALTALLVCVGCANPLPPGGGPRDTTPPSIVEARPAEGAVNVEQDVTVEIAFSEYIERGSFSQALSIAPALDSQAPEVDHDGRSVTITFPEPLRDNTTYILTLDTSLRDARGVELNAPITLAFSTGPTINRGRLSGRVLQADTGAPQEGIDIYAYALGDDAIALTDSLTADTAGAARPTANTLRAPRPASVVPPPDTLPERPAYRTQTDNDGRFQFDYLREQPYYVIALADVNRNRQPDASETYAAPPDPALVADSTGTAPARAWIATLRDTIPPEPVRVQSRSEQRHTVRFDTPVRLLDRGPTRWALRDSVKDSAVVVDAVYQRANEPRLVLLRTPPINPTPHRLILPDQAVADSVGNVVDPDTIRFTPADVADTLQTRFVRFTPASLAPDTNDVYTLLPDEPPGVRLNEPVDSMALRATITARDSVGAARPFTLTTRDGTTHRLQFTPPLAPAERVDVQVGGAPLPRTDTTFTRQFRRIPNRQLGSVGGTVALTAPPADSAADRSSPADSLRTRPAPPDTVSTASAPSLPGPIVVELRMEGDPPRVAPRQTMADSTGLFLFAQLPEGTYRFRAFLDLNRNGRWDGGQLTPYTPAEPITWSEGTVDNRPRWENILESPLQLDRPAVQ